MAQVHKDLPDPMEHFREHHHSQTKTILAALPPQVEAVPEAVSVPEQQPEQHVPHGWPERWPEEAE